MSLKSEFIALMTSKHPRHSRWLCQRRLQALLVIGAFCGLTPARGLLLAARKRVYELLKTNLIMHDIFLQLILNILFDCSCSTCYVIDFLRHSFDLNPLCFRVWLPDLPHFTTQDFFLLLKLFIYLRSNQGIFLASPTTKTLALFLRGRGFLLVISAINSDFKNTGFRTAICCGNTNANFVC